MEPKNNFSLLVQRGINHIIFPKNMSDAWQIYGDQPSFRSFISGHILVMDSDFYEQLPPHLKPIPCTETIIIPSNKHYRPKQDSYELAGNLASALQEKERSPGKKYFVVGSPSLYFESQQKDNIRHVSEVFTMETDTYSDGTLFFSLSDQIWDKKILQVIPRDKHQSIALTFNHWTRKNA